MVAKALRTQPQLLSKVVSSKGSIETVIEVQVSNQMYQHNFFTQQQGLTCYM